MLRKQTLLKTLVRAEFTATGRKLAVNFSSKLGWVLTSLWITSCDIFSRMCDNETAAGKARAPLPSRRRAADAILGAALVWKVGRQLGGVDAPRLPPGLDHSHVDTCVLA